MNRLMFFIVSTSLIVSIIFIIIHQKHKRQKELQKMRDFQDKTIAILERNISELKSTLKPDFH